MTNCRTRPALPGVGSVIALVVTQLAGASASALFPFPAGCPLSSLARPTPACCAITPRAAGLSSRAPTVAAVALNPRRTSSIVNALGRLVSIIFAFPICLHLMVKELSGRRLQMSKNQLPRGQKMTDVTAYETDPEELVNTATKWAMALWRRAGQLDEEGRERAMHKAARWAGVPPNTFWKLRYRRPREVGASVYFRLQAAYNKHVASVEANIAENLIALRALPATEANRRLVAQMEEFLGLAPGEAPRAASERTDQDQSINW